MVAGVVGGAGGQRQAIVVWRTHLEVLAGQNGASLPDDLQQAGRGEIAPSPTDG